MGGKKAAGYIDTLKSSNESSRLGIDYLESTTRDIEISRTVAYIIDDDKENGHKHELHLGAHLD